MQLVFARIDFLSAHIKAGLGPGPLDFGHQEDLSACSIYISYQFDLMIKYELILIINYYYSYIKIITLFWLATSSEALRPSHRLREAELEELTLTHAEPQV